MVSYRSYLNSKHFTFENVSFGIVCLALISLVLTIVITGETSFNAIQLQFRFLIWWKCFSFLFSHVIFTFVSLLIVIIWFLISLCLILQTIFFSLVFVLYSAISVTTYYSYGTFFWWMFHLMQLRLVIERIFENDETSLVHSPYLLSAFI